MRFTGQILPAEHEFNALQIDRKGRVVKFSERTRWDLTETPWAHLFAELRARGARLFDLTASNPTQCGFVYEAESILTPLMDRRALEYDPAPRGMQRAREAIANYYLDHSFTVDPDNLILTTSTSEAYSFLFRLLCDPGDEVLIARPSYPLFDFLAALDDVQIRPYDLFYDHGWHIDWDRLRRRLTSPGSGKARAVVVVNPNNPTGHFTDNGERTALEAFCRDHGLALIVDEVFLDYPMTAAGESFAAGKHEVPTFVLSGISKIAGLPQMKAAWIAASGPGSKEALARLEVIADTFLSMNSPVQCALPVWLAERHAIQRQILDRIRGNLQTLDSVLKDEAVSSGGLISRLEVEAGWYAVLRVPAVAPDEETVLRLLDQGRVAVHPGYFFGLPLSGWLVVSLLPEPAQFREGMERLVNSIC